MPDFVATSSTLSVSVSVSVVVLGCCLDISAVLLVFFVAENGLMTFASPQYFMQCIFRSLEGQFGRASRIRSGIFTALLMAQAIYSFY